VKEVEKRIQGWSDEKRKFSFFLPLHRLFANSSVETKDEGESEKSLQLKRK
jgi:hypothetical protein